MNTATTPQRMIELSQTAKSYAMRGGTQCHALRGISLSINAGEYVVVLGKSGSGKSTLLNLIAGLDRPTRGSVQVAGAAVAGLSENQAALWWGQHVGVVFQFFQLLPTLTAMENILLAMELVGKIPLAQRAPRALQLLDLVGVADQAHKLPGMLSGGQQQRVAIARALANDPPIVLADEPTGNLDSETAADIGALFHRLARSGKTLLIVTHDLALADAAHRVIELKDGNIVADRINAREPALASA